MYQIDFMPRGLTENTKESIPKILYLIKKYPGIHIRAIARSLEISPMIISGIVKRYMESYLDIILDQYGAKLKSLFIKGDKQDITSIQIINAYNIKKEIKRH